MDANFPGFRAAIARMANYEFCVSTEQKHQGIYPAQLFEDHGHHITIRPFLAGSGGVGRILIGGAMVAASIAIPGAQGWLTNMGIAVMLSGVSQLLTPKPKKNKGGDERRNSAFSLASGTADRNAAIPLLIGFHRVVGMPVVSSNNIVEDF